jgi:enoyl-CoA hydratase/carnithine racemase
LLPVWALIDEIMLKMVAKIRLDSVYLPKAIKTFNQLKGALMGSGFIRIERAFENRVAGLIIDRQDKMNSMTVEMRGEIGQAFRDFSKDKDLHVIVVSGSGDKAFSSGGDVAQFIELEPYELAAWGEEMAEIERCPKPVIASIDGHCLGAGMELALSCDIRVATDRSLLGLPEVSLGMIPGSGGSQRMLRIIGMGRSKFALMTARRMKAEEAERWGLVNICVAPEDLEETVNKLVDRILKMPPLSLRAIKTVLQQGSDAPLPAALELERKTYAWLRSTHDYVEGVKAFLEKRSPNYKGM